MKKSGHDFDESILDDAKAFSKRFRPISKNERPNAAINKALNASKHRITIYLDADVIAYFKKQTSGTRAGYQTLINQALREKIDTPTPMDDPIEKLLKDKKILRRLKESLKGV